MTAILSRRWDSDTRCWIVESRCPKCQMVAERFAGEPCDCGYPEDEREWDAQDFADDAMDRANKIESESR